MPKPRMKIIEIAALIAAGLGLCTVDSYWHRKAGYIIVGISSLVTLWVFIPWSRIFNGIRSVFKRKRFHSTVFYTDIVGYNSIKAEDEEKAKDIFDKCCYNIKPLIEKHHGKWLKLSMDCTISSFKLTIDAVRCAIEIQEKLSIEPDFNVRIGIHKGEVFFLKEEIVGKAVSVASGIELFAEPGGICITDEEYGEVKNELGLKFEKLGEKTINNVDRAMVVYKIKSEKPSEAELTKILRFEKKLPSIAVLPFINMSADPEQEYFCDGITEEIINALTHIENLRVIARTSAFAFKGKNEDIREIGKKLDVENLLEGSLRQSGNSLRITAQLIQVSDGSHLWSEKYDRDMEDIFEIQDEISLAIVQELKGKILPHEKRGIKKRYTEDSIAHEWYLKGWRFHNEYDFKNAFECFQQAVKQDPGFGPAYVGIAQYYVVMGYFGLMFPHDVFPKAKEAVSHALAIDEEIAIAHFNLSEIFWCYDWNWSAAEKKCKVGIELSPSSAEAHLGYGVFLEKIGRSEEALNELTDALHLDPLSPMIRAIIIYLYIRMGEYGKAQESIRIAESLDANVSSVYDFQKGMLALYQGDYLEAASIFKQLPRERLHNWHDACLGYAYGRAGQREKAIQVLQAMIERRRTQFAPAATIAFIYQGLGENDHAFEWLEQSFEDHDPHLTHLYAYPEWDLLRPDPRFKTLLKKMGFPED